VSRPQLERRFRFYSFDVDRAVRKLVTWTSKVGAKVEILGQGFAGATAVSFDGVTANSSRFDTYLTATVPSGGSPVRLRYNFTGASRATAFSLFRATQNFSPPSGPVGTSVTITGISLTQTTPLQSEARPASFTVNSDTQVTGDCSGRREDWKNDHDYDRGGKAASTAKFTLLRPRCCDLSLTCQRLRPWPPVPQSSPSPVPSTPTSHWSVGVGAS